MPNHYTIINVKKFPTNYICAIHVEVNIIVLMKVRIGKKEGHHDHLPKKPFIIIEVGMEKWSDLVNLQSA